MNLGICPQFDLLWPDLTVEEHLRFYAKLKGVSPKEENAKLDKAIKEVSLEKFKNFKTGQLSGRNYF
jgi:ABC-type multidrug transport system ATPase subunit